MKQRIAGVTIVLMLAGVGLYWAWTWERSGREPQVSYQFVVECNPADVAAALEIMEPQDTIVHVPCDTMEQEAEINALYERDMRGGKQ